MSDSRQYYESRMDEKDELISDMEERLCALKADMRKLEQQVLDARQLLLTAMSRLPIYQGLRVNKDLRADIEKWLEATKLEREGKP